MLVCSFLVISSSGFGIKVILTLKNELRNCSFLLYFLEEFMKD